MKQIVIVVLIGCTVAGCGSRSVCSESQTCTSDNPMFDASLDGVAVPTSDALAERTTADPVEATLDQSLPRPRDAGPVDASTPDANVIVRSRDATADAPRRQDAAVIDASRTVDAARVRDAASDSYVEAGGDADAHVEAARDAPSEAETDARLEDGANPGAACSKPQLGDSNCQRAATDYLCQMPDDTIWVLFASGAALHFRADDGPHVIVCELDTDGGLVAPSN
jgi:hypothetical protein